ncbi:MAG TPA: FecR family protein, partial [Gammaproteobacteria bacterium]|nr:FecR family protein [Gammaproteobacteria bacterium]
MKMQKMLNITPVLVILICGISPAYAASCGGGSGKMSGYVPPTPSATTAMDLLSNVKPVTPASTPISATTPPANPTPTTPQVPAAKVVWVKGTLKVVGPDKQVRTVQAGATLLPGDTIVTDKNSQAEVVFSDHTMVTFNNNTAFNITKYEYHPEVKTGSVGKSVMNLLTGSFRSVTGAIAKKHPADYQVNTEVAIMGVRGTDYGGAFQACKVYMKYYSGTPILHNDKGTIVLTQDSPFASVMSPDVAPVSVSVEPPVFHNALPIVPANFESIVSPKSIVPPKTVTSPA